MNAKITIAKSEIDGNPKHISEVSNGLDCKCICLGCGELMVAANLGKIQQKHFRHYSQSNCIGALETGLHQLAKRIISESKSIMISNEECFEYDSSNVEELYEDFTPDVLIKDKAGKFWLIEVAVTSFINSTKEQKIKKANVNCLEIDLKSTDRDMEFEELKTLLIDSSKQRRIINRVITINSIENEPVKKKESNGFNWVLGLIVSIGTYLLVKSTFRNKKKH